MKISIAARFCVCYFLRKEIAWYNEHYFLSVYVYGGIAKK